MLNMTPKNIVIQLNKYIIGQIKAKKSVAVALRNRWRRMQVNKSIREEINPKNILMIGPTGVGKTEIAKRLSKLSYSPFLKVEATKFTEVGYVGKEVESIIKDLVDISFKMIKNKFIKRCKSKAKKIVENKIINILFNSKNKLNLIINNEFQEENKIKEIIKKKLNDGLLEDEEIEINSNSSILGVEILSSSISEDINNQIQSLLKNISNQKSKIYKTKIKYARKLLIEEELNKLINLEEIKNKSIKLTEQKGIVFIDEIDKICKNYESNGLDVSREGVQRDLLPIVEGCSVSTKYGIVKTDYILFIASGSFKGSKISDLIPELQGRFPIKVELEHLTIKNFEEILTKTKTSIKDQYIALLKTEGINIIFTKCGIKKIAEISWKMNEKLENIGARRLHSVLEKIMEEISFYDFQYKEKKIIIDKYYVNNYLKELIKDTKQEKFIL